MTTSISTKAKNRRIMRILESYMIEQKILVIGNTSSDYYGF